VRANSDHNVRKRSQRLADLKNKTAQLERDLSDARMSLERELAQFAYAPGTAAVRDSEMPPWPAAEMYDDDDTILTRYQDRGDPDDQLARILADPERLAAERTEVLLNHGRRSAYREGLSGGAKAAIAAVVAAAVATAAVLFFTRGHPAWPASVTTVQRQVAQACQNPDVKSEPGQVNFACGKDTRQILWVLALMTSHDNADFADASTGRAGLEPITPAQGGQVAWSLNLHHPYNPANPIDSIEVAARAINNIIGGATVTGSNGRPVVQAGLESSPANCVRYTGSAAATSRKGFPRLCAKPVSSQAGQAALVADVYQQWIVGAPPKDAQNAALLFENATNPGDPRVQAILRQLMSSRPSA
jgi:hypothetical protein